MGREDVCGAGHPLHPSRAYPARITSFARAPFTLRKGQGRLVVGVAFVVVFEGLFGGVEGVYGCGESAVEEHLRDEFDDLLFRPAVVECACDVPGKLVGFVKDDERGYGADAADVSGQRLTLVDVSEEGGVDEVECVVGDAFGDRVWLWRAVVVPVTPFFGLC